MQLFKNEKTKHWAYAVLFMIFAGVFYSGQLSPWSGPQPPAQNLMMALIFAAASLVYVLMGISKVLEQREGQSEPTGFERDELSAESSSEFV